MVTATFAEERSAMKVDGVAPLGIVEVTKLLAEPRQIEVTYHGHGLAGFRARDRRELIEREAAHDQSHRRLHWRAGEHGRLIRAGAERAQHIDDRRRTAKAR